MGIECRTCGEETRAWWMGQCPRCISTERSSLTSALTAAKEEIERFNGLETYLHGKIEAAESALSSERKETERLRGLLRSIACFRPHMGTPADMQAIAQQEFLETAALQSRQGEE